MPPAPALCPARSLLQAATVCDCDQMNESGKMQHAFEVKLITLVKKHPLLYDVSTPMYSDQAKKDEAWAEIANVMSSTAYDCKVKWTRLRDNFRKARLNREKNGNKICDRAIKYEKELHFLSDRFLVRKHLRPKLIKPIPDEAVDSDSSQHSKVEYLPTPVIDTVSTLNEFNIPCNQLTTSKPVHELNVFFEGIAETVKHFPKKTQIQLKRKIFNMVNDTEASLFGEENEASCSNARSQEEDDFDDIATKYSDNNTANYEQNVLNTTFPNDITVKEEIDEIDELE